MKKLFILLGVLVLAFVFVGCGDTQISTNNGETPLVEITSTETTADAGISDEEIHRLYQRAFEALGWFQLTTIPGEWLGIDGAIEMYGNLYDVRVTHDRISNLADLRVYLAEIFTEDFVDNLFSTYVDGGEIRRFVDVDGVLYTFGADRGTNITAGEIRYRVIRQNAEKIIFQVSVDIHDFETPWDERSPDNAIDIEESNFVLINIDGVWLFSDFWLVI